MEAVLGCVAGILVGITTAWYFQIKPIADRDKTIANQKAMIKNRDEKLDKVIAERNALREYKQNVKNVINLKATIVDKYDKIKELAEDWKAN